MRGGAVPPALLCAAVALALAFAPRRTWPLSLAILITTTVVFAMVPTPHEWMEGVFLGGWVSVAATAATVHLPGGLTARTAAIVSLNAGLWSGAEIAIAGSRLDIAKALVGVLLISVAEFTVDCRVPIVAKVIASWLIAVAILVATLQLLPVTPGYLQDHLD